MQKFGIFSILASVLLFVGVSGSENELARGWNGNINWVTLEEGKKLSRELNKPLMIVIHKSWCGACKDLKPKFAESDEIEELSSSFVMVNTLDTEEPDGEEYKPDGGYIPRIIFFSPSGKRLPIVNEGGGDRYKHYYHMPSNIVDSMKRCLKTDFSARSTGSDEL